MKALSLSFIIIAVLMLLIMVVISFTFFGLWLSEIGLWFSWIPLTFLIVSIPFLIQMVDDIHLRIDFFLMLISSIFNLITYIRMMIPFLSIRRTNQKFQKIMKQSLGENYLAYIDPSIRSRFFKSVNFKLSHYFKGINERRLNKVVSSIEQITYRKIGETEIKLNAYFPKRSVINPIIIFIHGGGWMQGSKDQGKNEKAAKLLASYGYSVFNIDYRLSTPDFLTKKGTPHDSTTIREMVSDVRSAIIFAKKNAQNYKGNPDEIFLFGRSAGAHLALLTAFSCEQKYFDMEAVECSIEDMELVGVIAFYPITDLEELYEFYDKTNPLRLALLQGTGGELEKYRNLYKIFSPINYITEETAEMIPPIFLAAGKYDKVVDVYQSEELFEEFQKYKIPSVYLELPWANHSFDHILSGPGGQLVYKYLTQFLVWSLSRKKMIEIEKLAADLGIEDIISTKKIEILHANKGEKILLKNHLLNYSNKINDYKKKS